MIEPWAAYGCLNDDVIMAWSAVSRLHLEQFSPGMIVLIGMSGSH
jgi:hypothetical protein